MTDSIKWMLIKVKVSPNSNREEIIKESEDSFQVAVKAKPVKGLANKAVVGALSLYFNIPTSQIRLVKGFRERNKVFEITKTVL